MGDIRKSSAKSANLGLPPEIARAAKAVNQIRGSFQAAALSPEIARAAKAFDQMQGSFQVAAMSPEIARAMKAFDQMQGSFQVAAMSSEIARAAKAANQILGALPAVGLSPGITQTLMGIAQAQDRARAFDLGFRRVPVATETIASLTPLTPFTLPESLDSALRPTAANPFKSTAPYSVRQIPKRTHKKTAPDPVARLRNLGNPIAASYCEDALALLELGFNRNSAHSSMCAIESVVREVDPNKDFGQVINRMRDERVIHPAIADMIKKWWGYGSNQPGMRHADYPSSPFPAVSAKDARMLYGVCAFIAEYLADTQD